MEVKEAGKLRGEFTFQWVEVSHTEVGGPVSVWHLLSQKGSKRIKTAARGSKTRQQDVCAPGLRVTGTRRACSLGREGEQLEGLRLEVRGLTT